MKNRYQGRQLPTEVVNLVVQLKKHYDDERKTSKSVSTRNSAGRTASALGLFRNPCMS